MRWRHVGPRGQREGNITFFSFFFINPSSSSSPFLPHFVRLFVFQGNSFPLPVSLAVDGVHFIISHYFFVIMKDFFPWGGLRIGSPRRWNVSRMEMKFEFVDSRVFLGRVFPVNFPISRLGDRRRSIILFCSVFSLLFFIYKQRCCNNWDNWDECREIFPWVNMADSKLKFQRLIKDDFFSSRILTFGSLFVFHFYFMQSIWYIC